jgi:hypothetical protein
MRVIPELRTAETAMTNAPPTANPPDNLWDDAVSMLDISFRPFRGFQT